MELSERVSLQGTLEDGSNILMQTPQGLTVYRAGGCSAGTVTEPFHVKHTRITEFYAYMLPRGAVSRETWSDVSPGISSP